MLPTNDDAILGGPTRNVTLLPIVSRRCRLPSVDKLAEVFFTVTSMPQSMVMNVHAEAGNPL